MPGTRDGSGRPRLTWEDEQERREAVHLASKILFARRLYRRALDQCEPRGSCGDAILVSQLEAWLEEMAPGWQGEEGSTLRRATTGAEGALVDPDEETP